MNRLKALRMLAVPFLIPAVLTVAFVWRSEPPRSGSDVALIVFAGVVGSFLLHALVALLSLGLQAVAGTGFGENEDQQYLVYGIAAIAALVAAHIML